MTTRYNKVLSSTDLADVSSGQTDQCGEPVCDVEESLGDASPVSQQRTGEQQEERPARGVVTLQDLASSLREKRGRVFPLLTPGHALVVVEVVAAQPRAVAGAVAERQSKPRCHLPTMCVLYPASRSLSGSVSMCDGRQLGCLGLMMECCSPVSVKRRHVVPARDELAA
ncbi:hypothetical protein INR49_000721 [Caranx melampygus]|nr:hypothetical protein INR49_000721 [Caranx melampygus]